MKALAACALALTVASASARADEHAHRLVVAGAVLTAMGAVVAVGAVAPVTDGANHVPIDVYHGACGDNCVHHPTNWPLDLGAAALSVGAVALGTGIALVVIGKRREQKPSLALGARGLRVHF